MRRYGAWRKCFDLEEFAKPAIRQVPGTGGMLPSGLSQELRGAKGRRRATCRKGSSEAGPARRALAPPESSGPARAGRGRARGRGSGAAPPPPRRPAGHNVGLGRPAGGAQGGGVARRGGDSDWGRGREEQSRREEDSAIPAGRPLPPSISLPRSGRGAAGGAARE